LSGIVSAFISQSTPLKRTVLHQSDIIVHGGTQERLQVALLRLKLKRSFEWSAGYVTLVKIQSAIVRIYRSIMVERKGRRQSLTEATIRTL